jgi:hypothetical protein
LIDERLGMAAGEVLRDQDRPATDPRRSIAQVMTEVRVTPQVSRSKWRPSQRREVGPALDLDTTGPQEHPAYITNGRTQRPVAAQRRDPRTMLTATKFMVAVVSAVLIGAFVASGMLTSPGPTAPRAAGPASPGAAASASPGSPRITWSTERVDLSAEDFRLEVNDLVFGDADWTQVSSDPGSSDYWTLEIIWTEHDAEQRLNMYFGSDGTDWWVDEIRTYDGHERGEWVYAYGPFFQTPLGEAFEGDVSIDLRGQGRPDDPDALIPAVLSFDGLRLAVSPTASGSSRKPGKAGRDTAIPTKKAARLERALAAAIGDPLAGGDCHTSSEVLDLTTSVFAELGMTIEAIGGGPPARDNECAVAEVNSEGTITISTVVRPDVTAVLDDLRASSLTECLDATTAVDTLTESLQAVGHDDFVIELDGPLAGPIGEQEELKAHAEAGCVVYTTTGRDGNGTPVYYLYGG